MFLLLPMSSTFNQSQIANSNPKSHKSTSVKYEQFPPNSWQSRVYKKDAKNRMQIDNTRLIYEAQRLARNSNATNEDISDVLRALNDQISGGEYFQKEASSRTEKLVNERKKMQDAVQAHLTKKEDLRKEYLKLRNKNEKKNRDHKFETIGDELDYDISYQCLKLEVEQLTKDVSFLRIAFGNDDSYIPVQNSHQLDNNNGPISQSPEDHYSKSQQENESVEEEKEYEIIVEEEEEEDEKDI